MANAPEQIAAAIKDLEQRGYVAVDEHDGIRAGARVRNVGEKYLSAYRRGTATVVAVMLKDPSPWAKSYGRPDVEVVVDRDDPDRGPGPWADYGTVLATEQPGRESTSITRTTS